MQIPLPTIANRDAAFTSKNLTGSILRSAPILILLLLIYRPVVADLVQEWLSDDAQSQGMIIPPLALYTVWLNRRSTLGVPAAPETRGLWGVFTACAILSVGIAGSEFFLMRISIIVMLAGLVWTFWGIARLRTLAFPLILLSTMVPLPMLVYSAIAAPLQLFTSTIGTALARLFGVAIYQDGNIIHLASISLGVNEACSGLRSLTALAAASLLLGHIERLSLHMRVVLFASALPISLVMNILRVTGTAVLADINGQYAMGFYHSFSGWVVFLFSFAGLLVMTRYLTRRQNGRRAGAAA